MRWPLLLSLVLSAPGCFYLAVCGDGIRNVDLEPCDDGNLDNGDGCNSSCEVEFCGDGITQSALGEGCDDGNNIDGDACSSVCLIGAAPVCGDFIIESPETCDDGNLSSGDGCSASCVNEVCGDGVIQAGEECDDGNLINSDECPPTCAEAFCGDGFVLSGVEQCDDANNIDDDACRNDCTQSVEICNGVDDDGDSSIDEGCDDDNDDFCDSANFVVDANAAGCPNSADNAQGDDCQDNGAGAANFFPGALERCGSGVEEDCGAVAGDNNGCDDDNDDFCDNANFVVNAAAAGCANSPNGQNGNDCIDGVGTVNPAATEICGSGVDEDCGATFGDNNGCDDDDDDFCDAVHFVVDANAAGCANSANNAQGNDCNDAADFFFPGALERCGSNAEEDCGAVAGDNNGCDDDDDNFCDESNFVVNGALAGCVNSVSDALGDDCNDNISTINPGFGNCP